MKITNTKFNPTQLIVLTIVSLICLLIPLTIFGLWVYVFDLGSTQVERVAIFKDYFPGFLKGRWDTTYLGIVFCVLAIVFSGLSLRLSSKFWKALNILILLISSLILLLNLFSMM